MSARHTVKRAKSKRKSAEQSSASTRLRTMSVRDIERAVRRDPEAAPILNDRWLRNAKLVMPIERKPRIAISLRVERDLVDWFKALGGPYQSRMHAVLKAFVDAHRGG